MAETNVINRHKCNQINMSNKTIYIYRGYDIIGDGNGVTG